MTEEGNNKSTIHAFLEKASNTEINRDDSDKQKKQIIGFVNMLLEIESTFPRGGSSNEPNK